MQNEYAYLGKIIKSARENSEMTAEEIAEKAQISGTYLFRLERGERLPSFETLCKLIRILSIPPDLIFYPERNSVGTSEVEKLIRMIYQCDERSCEIVRAPVKALLDTVPEKKTIRCQL